MTKIRETWTPVLPAIPEEELEQIAAMTNGEFREVCCCFWLFRYLHRFQSAEATLEGDYCFGRLSQHLSKLDNVPLTDAFAAFLRKDTVERQSLDAYLVFLQEAGALI